MRNSAEFARAFHGTRGGSRLVVVAISRENAENVADLPPKVGFVVPKSVGNSVVRHRIYRQFRHIMRARIDQFAPGELIVVRALPDARGKTSEALEREIDRCLEKARQRALKQRVADKDAGEAAHANTSEKDELA